jgi:8-oxo-dGTP diphosphatase
MSVPFREVLCHYTWTMKQINLVSTIITNDSGEVLFVREAKEVHRGMWNLPGGRLEVGERFVDAATREVLEETFLPVRITHLLGVYTGRNPELHSIRFVFYGYVTDAREPEAGDEILEIKWMPPDTVLAMEDSALVGAPYLRAILTDFKRGASFPVDFIRDI